ncbi:MAG: hypothetical protein KJ559_00040 [Nanoarchaeota archaeon]|nr:hypothetical protein [Nanoarchaeota archaeon]
MKSGNKTIIILQMFFILIVSIILWFGYPKTDFELNGNAVNVKSINANAIIISENPDFSNPRYLDIENKKNLSFKLNPGIYYWKSANNFIKGFGKKFVINSEVGMKIEKDEETNKSDLMNTGNIKINITKSEEGVLVGSVILEPEEKQEIENVNEEYIGGQDG